MKNFLFFLKKYQLHLEFALIVFFILGPIFKFGHIFLTDFVLPPRQIAWSGDWRTSSFLWQNFLSLMSRFLGTAIIERLFFAGIIFLILIGAYKLPRVESQWPRYFAAFLFLFNPFVYSRFLYGQIGILFAYSLLPFLFRFFWVALNSEKTAWLKIVAIFLFISMIDSHSILFIIFGLAVFSLLNILAKRKWKNIKTAVIVNFKILFFTVILSSYWFIPTMLGNSNTATFISQQIDQRHFSAFQTASDQTHGVIWNTAAMYGFWGDREGRYVAQKEMVPYWFQLYLVILALVVWGVVSSLCPFIKRIFNFQFSKLRNSKFIQNSKFKIQNSSPTSYKLQATSSSCREQWIVLSFVAIGIISLILAVGIAYPPFVPLINWLNKCVPFYKGYREPQKWVAMLILSYTYLAALGVDDLIPRLQGWIKKLEDKIKI